MVAQLSSFNSNSCRQKENLKETRINNNQAIMHVLKWSWQTATCYQSLTQEKDIVLIFPCRLWKYEWPADENNFSCSFNLNGSKYCNIIIKS